MEQEMCPHCGKPVQDCRCYKDAALRAFDSALAMIMKPTPATDWLLSDRVTALLARFKAEDEAEGRR